MFRKSLLILVLVLGLTACGQAAAPVTTLTVLASDFAYTPSEFTVPLGETVRITFQNDGLVTHDFVIEEIALTNLTAETSASNGMGHDMGAMEFDLHISTNAGQSSTIEFTPAKAGTYVFFCTVPGHKEAGMVGTLIVMAP